MKKLITMMVVAGLAVAAFAAADDTLITFSTPGPDKYADGSDVLAGECYALVWSQNGTFEGIKADGTTVDSKDKVLLVAPVAKQGDNGMCCPPHLFQVDSDLVKNELKGGVFDVYLLDTRVMGSEGEFVVGGLDENGLLKNVSSYSTVSEAASLSGEGSAAVVKANAKVVDGATVTTYTLVNPVITSIKPNGARVAITAVGLSPTAEYKVVTGQTPDSITVDLNADIEKNGDTTTFTFDKPAGSGAMFKIYTDAK